MYIPIFLLLHFPYLLFQAFGDLVVFKKTYLRIENKIQDTDKLA